MLPDLARVPTRDPVSSRSNATGLVAALLTLGAGLGTMAGRRRPAQVAHP
jgi:hypothetical protein